MNEPLKLVAYVSEATQSFTRAEIHSLVQECSERNHARAISGTIVFTDPVFFQIVEGPEAAINRLMGAIHRDPRHMNIEIVFERTPEERLFPDWSLGYCDASVRPPVQRSLKLIHANSQKSGTFDKEITRLIQYLRAFYAGRAQFTH